ncbi:MAG: GH116 family glycosyl hydrolase [Bacteroidota bacterium]
MRINILLLTAILFLSGFGLSRADELNILLIAKGEVYQEIIRYYQDRDISFTHLDMEIAAWKDYELEKYDSIWIHRNDTLPEATHKEDEGYYKALLAYAEDGGSILLTQHALDFLNKSGLEEVKVQHRMKVSEDNGYGRMLGFHAFIQHPLFDSLHGGAYVWKPPADTTVSQCGFFNEQVPLGGKVIAVDWDYIFVREKTKLIVEYITGKGRILGIGAYFNLFTPNLNRAHYDVFYDNVFSYLTGERETSDEHYWSYGKPKIAPLDFVLLRQIIPPSPKKWKLKKSSIALSRAEAKNEYCEAAGRRLLLTAYEKGGIFEVWAHPFMAFRDYKASIYFNNDSILPLNSINPTIELAPEYVMRTYRVEGKFTLKEIIAVSPDKAVGVIHYEYEGPEAKLAIQYKSNMRLMWPYSGQVLKTLKYGYDPGLNAIEFNAPDASLLTLIGANKIPVSRYSGPTNRIEPSFPDGEIVTGEYNEQEDTLFEVSAGQLFELGEEGELDIIFAAGNDSRKDILRAYTEAMRDPAGIYANSIKHYAALSERMLSIITPDENFNSGYAWALAATERFFVETPGLGTSLVAGYNGTDRGWDGGHKINGRPGYAWYFGRDAVWSAFAILDYGDFEGVRKVLDMFVKYQDLSGKIFHELSTSGFVHYDASDATPLFIILAGRYLKHSGDISYIQSIWPAIEKAIQYCESTDTDGDGLIENTNVGHGWVEGGHLFGSHTSLYLASCWAEALSNAASLAGSMELEYDKSEYYLNSRKVVNKISYDFFNPENGFMYQGIFQDGSYHKEESILPSIPMYFEQIPDIKLETMLQAFASNDFTADWGVRIARQSGPHYHPRGYHSGSVWPLFTGWVALAEYKLNRPLQGFGHIMNNLNVYKSFSLAYVEEVLNGQKYTPSGVCPHQCWSQTMVLQPVIEGLLGLEPDASRNKLHIYPSIPYEWDSIKVKNIRLANRYINWKMLRQEKLTTYTFEGQTAGLVIDFQPLFPEGTQISEIIINGKSQAVNACTPGGGVRLKIYHESTGDTEIIVKHNGGISLITPECFPLANEESSGIRIIDTYWNDNTYIIKAEGAAGMQYELEVISDMGSPKSVSGAKYTQKGNRIFLKTDFPAMKRGYSSKIITLQF